MTIDTNAVGSDEITAEMNDQVIQKEVGRKLTTEERLASTDAEDFLVVCQHIHKYHKGSDE